MAKGTGRLPAKPGAVKPQLSKQQGKFAPVAGGVVTEIRPAVKLTSVPQATRVMVGGRHTEGREKR